MLRSHDRTWRLATLAAPAAPAAPAVLAVLAVFLGAGAARANDSAAGLDGGQLVLKQASGVRMVSEELSLSMTEVRIRYELRNTGKKDVETLVAFPLPPMPLKADLDEGIVGGVTYDPASDNPLGFACRVDGQPVKTKLERKALKDRDGKDSGHALTYYWPQRFPAGRTIVVEHTYKPALWQAYAPRPSAEDTARYCIDAGTRKAIGEVARADRDKLYFSNGLNYILRTARNWSGPIGDFHLTIDKGDARNVLSLCLDGIKKTSPTRFELRKKDFVPDRDLALLFVTARERAPGQPPAK